MSRLQLPAGWRQRIFLGPSCSSEKTKFAAHLKSVGWGEKLRRRACTWHTNSDAPRLRRREQTPRALARPSFLFAIGPLRGAKLFIDLHIQRLFITHSLLLLGVCDPGGWLCGCCITCPSLDGNQQELRYSVTSSTTSSHAPGGGGVKQPTASFLFSVSLYLTMMWKVKAVHNIQTIKEGCCSSVLPQDDWRLNRVPVFQVWYLFYTTCSYLYLICTET